MLAQPEVALQRVGGEADVDAVDVGDDVAEEHEGDQPARDARHDELVTGRGLIGHRISAWRGHDTISARRGVNGICMRMVTTW